MFEKYGPNEINFIRKISLFLILQWYRSISLKLVHWGHIYRIRRRNTFIFNIISIYSKIMTDIKKKVFDKTVIFFLYASIEYA